MSKSAKPVVVSGKIDTSPAAGYLETPARAPTAEGGKVVAYISESKAKFYLVNGPAHKFHEVLHCVRAVLSDPDAILAYNSGDWTGYCYARQVDNRYNNRGDQLVAFPDQTFLVFMSATNRVIEWGFEPCDPEDPDLPANKRDGERGVVIWRA